MQPDIKRLQKIADHLLKGKLGHKEFSFATYNCGATDDNNRCGTLGCAIGELPILFPEDWHFDPISYLPKLKEYSNYTSVDACKYLNITYLTYAILFTPYERHYRVKGLIVGNIAIDQLSEDATKEEVANNILKYIEAITKV